MSNLRAARESLMSDAVAVAATVAAGFTYLSVCLGLPSQIRRNARRRSTEGASLPMFALGAVCAGSWVLYGVLTRAPEIIGPNALGAVLGVVIMIQFAAYRGRGAAA